MTSTDPGPRASDPGVVVVLGASSGIGRAAARQLAARGARLVLGARDEGTLRETEAECRADGASDTLVAVVDVTDQDEVDRAVSLALERYGRIDGVLVTAASLAYGRFEELPGEVFDRVVAVDLLGSANVARAVLPVLRRQRRGTLVLTSSLVGHVVAPYMSAYATSKWGLRGLVRTLQIENRDLPDVHVCTVSPGAVNTPIYAQAGAYGGSTGHPPPPVDPPEKVARALVAQLDDPRRDRSVGLANRVAELGFVLLPGVYDALVEPLMRLAGLDHAHTDPTPGNVFDSSPAGNAQRGPWGRHWLKPVGAAAAGATGAAVAAAVATLRRR